MGEVAAQRRVDTFLAVSCPTARMCVAVGKVTLNAADTMLAERWNGHSWSVTRLAHPPGATNSFLTGVSCTSARSCTAVGSVYVPSTGGGPLAERWDGSRWTVEVTPSPGNEGVPFAAVSCGSATSCTAVGYYDFGAVGFTPDTLAEHWNGRRWTIQSLPLAGNPGGALSAVSCRSRVACTAAGYYDGTSDEDPGTAPLAMRWDGSSWTAEPTPGDAGQNDTSGLTGVSCATASTCTAVGESVYGGPLAMRWDGTKWRTQKVVGDFSLLGFNGVSCPSATACIAIGGAYGQRWNGRKWAFQHIGVPPGARLQADRGVLHLGPGLHGGRVQEHDRQPGLRRPDGRGALERLQLGPAGDFQPVTRLSLVGRPGCRRVRGAASVPAIWVRMDVVNDGHSREAPRPPELRASG
jgi:hypothetical protein